MILDRILHRPYEDLVMVYQKLDKARDEISSLSAELEACKRIMAETEDEPYPPPGPWRQELDEAENHTVVFSVYYSNHHLTAPVPGRNLILLIAKLAKQLDASQLAKSRLESQIRDLNRPHNIVRRAADIMFAQYKQSAFQELAKDPFRE
jgi:hypothetical protein